MFLLKFYMFIFFNHIFNYNRTANRGSTSAFINKSLMHLNMVFQNINNNSSYYLAGTEGRSLPLLNLITWKMAKDKFGFIFTIDPLDKDTSL